MLNLINHWPDIDKIYLNAKNPFEAKYQLLINQRENASIKYYQQTFQRCFNVVFRLIWRRNVVQHQINVETTLCTSRFGFTTLSNVEPTLAISTLIWTTLGNVEATLSFSMSIYITLSHIETTLRIWPLKKWKNKLWGKNIIILLSFDRNHLNWIRWTQNPLHFVPHFKEYM